MAFVSNVRGQMRPDPRGIPPWADTTGESGVSPIGDAVGVYRAALDLLYIDGEKKPSIIVMHDTAERRSSGPCPLGCNRAWPHQSPIDTSTILSFARVSPKRPRIRNFGYSIPIALVSDADVQRMRHDGLAYQAAHNLPMNTPGTELWVEFRRKYPGAWGLATLTNVGFNDRHTEALVEVRHWCGEYCLSDEILFLKLINTKWVVVERIPNAAEASPTNGNLRYRGPAGRSPNESELLVNPSVRPATRSELSDGAAVYRTVLDSLYSFQGESPKMIVLTDRLRIAEGGLPPHKSRIDSVMLQKYAFLGAVRTSLDPAFKYRLPIAILPEDSMPKLEALGVPLRRKGQVASPFWLAFRKKFPNAWGMVGFSRVAFNPTRTQALVYSSHECGAYCNNGDTWVLARESERWRIVERIPREKSNYWDLEQLEQEQLRYVGLDAKPNSYRHRRVYGAFTNAVTEQPLSSLNVNVFRSTAGSHVFTTDSAGRFALGTMPFNGFVAMTVGCPDQSRPDSILALELLVTPGLDTTANARIDFRQCFRESREPTPRTLSGAEALISATEARFVFPRRGPGYTWDLPIKGAYPGSWEYWWYVDWNGPQVRDGEDPLALWLMTAWKQGGPRKGSLAELIAGRKLDPMINCVACDGAVFADPETDHKNVFASVDDGRLVFKVRGRDAVKSMFPVIPSTVRFVALVAQVPLREHGPGDTQESQAVFVNCHNSDSSAASRRRCDVPPTTKKPLQGYDSAALRRVHVVVLSYDGASLMRNLDVRIQSEDKKKPIAMRSTGPVGSFVLLHPPSDSVTLEALCPETRRGQRTISGHFGLYVTPAVDTTVQMMVDPRMCSR